jgi:hypothetical protein
MTRTLSMQKMLEAKNAALEEFFSLEADRASVFLASTRPKHNVVGVGIGRKVVRGKPTNRQCVRLYVEHKVPKHAVPRHCMLPAEVLGIATDVIETGRFYASGRIAKEQLRIRPARPGCSVGFSLNGEQADNVMAGTFGALVQAKGQQFILSNNHVLANHNASAIGSTIYQPGLLDKNAKGLDAIARLSKFIPLVSHQYNRVDCAIAAVLDNRLVSPPVMPKVGRLKSAIPLEAARHMMVEKTGRATGYTTGTDCRCPRACTGEL